MEDGAADATGLRPAGEDVIVNLSVWETREALWDFAYRSGHLELMRRRREWFERHVQAHLVLWWVPAGHIPTVAEALERLADLRTHGPSPRAFHLHLFPHRRRGPGRGAGALGRGRSPPGWFPSRR